MPNSIMQKAPFHYERQARVKTGKGKTLVTQMSPAYSMDKDTRTITGSGNNGTYIRSLFSAIRSNDDHAKSLFRADKALVWSDPHVNLTLNKEFLQAAEKTPNLTKVNL